MKPHPLYPFISMVRWFEHEPDLAASTDHPFSPEDWGAFYPDGTVVQSWFTSEQALLDGVGEELHARRPDIVDDYIEKAKSNGDFDLLIRLVDGRAAHRARAQMRVEVDQRVAAVESAVKGVVGMLRGFRNV